MNIGILLLITLITLINTDIASCFVEIAVSIGVGAGAILQQSLCYFKSECCDDNSIPANFDKLEKDLGERIYGQSIVQEIVSNALRSHWDPRNTPQKALTLSFHGWPGGGKNYVANFIMENLYRLGHKSAFVHQFIGRIHFPRSTKVAEYQNELYRWIKGNVSLCQRQIFVFDEVDKMPAQVLDALKPIIDYRASVDGVDFRKCIFIFLSNTGSTLINDMYLDLWRQGGIKRDDLKLKHFENLILQGAFTEEGGFQFSDAIKSNLIDHFIPFLPMERQHVRSCIEDEFRKRNITSPRTADIDEAMEFVQWGPSNEQLFSKTGCKRISQKVGMIAAKNKLYN